MALQSNLLRGDPELEACLVRDSAHVVTGAVGAHVAKIQTALARLDGAGIASAEIAAKLYGTSTANAVLAFKKKRNIINHSYQNTADNIVGKMTVTALDSEMLAWERSRQPTRCCGAPIIGSPSSSAFVQPASFRLVGQGSRGTTVAQQTTPQVAPANLNILWQVTTLAAKRGAHRQLSLISRALELLRPHNIGIMSSVSSPPDAPFANEDIVDSRFRDDVFAMRKAADKVRPGFLNVLRIVVCPFESGSVYYGLTDGGTLNGSTFPDFILINVNKIRDDMGTFLHEAVHATGLKDHDNDETSIFSGAPNRTVLKPEHAQRLRTAFFAR